MKRIKGTQTMLKSLILIMFQTKITDDEHPVSCVLNGYPETKASPLDQTVSTTTSRTPIDTGPLVHIEKTSDEEEIEVDIDGDVDMEAPDINRSMYD